MAGDLHVACHLPVSSCGDCVCFLYSVQEIKEDLDVAYQSYLQCVAEYTLRYVLFPCVSVCKDGRRLGRAYQSYMQFAADYTLITPYVMYCPMRFSVQEIEEDLDVAYQSYLQCVADYTLLRFQTINPRVSVCKRGNKTWIWRTSPTP